MKLFNLDKTYSVVCESKGNKNGFVHIATLLRNGIEVDKTKKQYYNRTWECFEYETVLKQLIDESCLNEKLRKKYIQIIDNTWRF